MVPADSDGVPPAPPYSGSRFGLARLRLRASHPLRGPFPGASPRRTHAYSSRALLPRRGLDPSGLGSSAFARHYRRNHACSPLLPLLGCFGSRRSPRLYRRCAAFSRAGSPIRTPPDLRPFAPPRGFSQLVASFLASESLGIPRAPFLSLRPAAPRRSPAPAPRPPSSLQSLNELPRPPHGIKRPPRRMVRKGRYSLSSSLALIKPLFPNRSAKVLSFLKKKQIILPLFYSQYYNRMKIIRLFFFNTCFPPACESDTSPIR